MKNKQYSIHMLFKMRYNYSGFKLGDAWYFEDDEDGNYVLVFLKRTRVTCDCPCCNGRTERIEEEYTRRARDLDVQGVPCFVVFTERKIRCVCGYRGLEKLGFVRPYSRCTKSFEMVVAGFCRELSILEVARQFSLDWKTVKEIDKQHIKDGLSSLSMFSPSRIGVDEVAYEKGHRYLTIVRDVDLRCVLWVGIGRKKETLDCFFIELGVEKCKGITACCMDMWDPYVASVREWTNADIVFDKFHIAKKINEALDLVRKKEFAKKDPVDRKTMKKKRFLILRRNENVPDDRREELESLLEANEILFKGYVLKEEFLDILDEDSIIKAVSRFAVWMKNVVDSGINEFQDVLKTLKHYWYGIVNIFKHRLTNAGSEGFNNKINLVKRRAYGYHDLEYFILKIIQACGYKPSS